MAMGNIGQHIQRRQPLAVRSRRDHRRASRAGRQIAGQGIGTAHMPGKQADDKTPVNFAHHHGRIHGLAPEIRRHRPHCDTRRANEHMRGVCMKLLFHHL